MNVYLIGVLISFAIYLLAGFIVSKTVKTADDFFVAGRNAPTGLIVGSMVASLISTGLFLGDSGEAYNGIFVAVAGCAAVSAGGYILGAMFFSRFVRRSGAYTIPSFFEQRFNSRAVGIMAVIASTVAMAVYLLSVTQGVGTLMSFVTGVEYNFCIILAVAVFTIVTVISGSRGVLITDTLMFGIFTTVGVISVLVVASDAGGWYNAVISLASNPETRDLLSWSGKLGYMYDTGLENFIWYLGYGICWAGVSICAPWQCTRNIMAKNEHTIIRSAVFVVIGCFAINYIVEIGATFFHLFDIGETASTQVYVWAAMNLLPPVLGVILITGIIAAGISSSTTFLSLIGSSIANDLFKTQDENKKVLVSKASMIVVALIVIFIACTNPANIWWIMQIGATVVICSLLPPAIASIWSKKTTKAGAFAGMLVGFTVSFLMKIIGTSLGITYPIYCDVYFVATAANIIAMLVVNRFTTVSNVEMERREALFVVPSGESDVIEIEKTRKAIKSLIWIGLGISIFCIITWVIPYNIGLTL